ncbi:MULTISPECIES: MocR-like pyridoxine biosynthesis transcription factor PdxR [Brevibacillus]|jgi:GntR family transcriptional regulator, regulator for abcA and norABC|uniref:MocR-like pyridoxine biosynthesis transcription factor PdxR n=1 Tax=Brevibacillus TaxID=55080 RepID=UPI0004F2E17C|nr:PLP-dependent aminotransferase family protein [Brevibacillus borstelensis]KKX57201.1 GntR family transcriptional regulator [Brevibacillus borstelensis cifa_chp40]MBE5395290.1 PLP-dependent aminotransferase family protein [Brevibacillus borstelensis]MED1744430.1 PLP-dependent aminotransferase family protein [Brevibacillus borstelensis]MED1873658.1 PLP-dependent aminotransferase family protein [Brevibacillus borstelensis]WNF08347.1 PLP-dependent aminotransferase family protein [Brevibacillus 
MLKLDWKPDKHADLPVYLQIIQYIKEKIASGEWPVHTRLPTQRAMAEAWGVNRSTVVTALDELKAEGLIESVVGSGTVVSNNTWSVLASAAPPDWMSYVQTGDHPSNMQTIQDINKYESDPSMIRLGTGELSPDLLPLRETEEILGSLRGRLTHLGYSEPKGWLPLRKAVSGYLRTRGIEASPASILIVSGALQALQLISQGILRQGSGILLERPSYLYSLSVFQASRMRLLGIPMDDEGIRPESLARQKQLRDAALLYTIPSFHNPTGTLMSEDRRRQVMAICERERLPILEDDVYGELWLDEPGPLPLKALDQNGLVLYTGSLSKTLSPGLRIGWIVGPEPVIERLADVKMQTDYGASALSQLAAAEWLRGNRYEQHLKRVRASLKERRNLTCSALSRWFSGIAEWQEPRGGFYIWLRLEQARSMRTLFLRALSEGILLNPGYVYDQTDSQHMRLSYAYASEEDLEHALYRLSQLLRK